MSSWSRWEIPPELVRKAEEIETEVRPYFERVAAIREYNQLKVLAAMQEAHISESFFGGTTGYGYDDSGRARLERAYAHAFGAEAALVRPQISTGTHALAVTFFAITRPGHKILSVTGAPYDTLHDVIGIRRDERTREHRLKLEMRGLRRSETEMSAGRREKVPLTPGSLRDWGVDYKQVDLLPDGNLDFSVIEAALSEQPEVVFVQRSRGYHDRPAVTIDVMRELVRLTRRCSPDSIIFVDNCYGEFVERDEPTEVGVDICAGSLNKNPGGGRAVTGGYIVGRNDLVLAASNRLYAPGLGRAVGPSLGTTRDFSQGLYLAPQVVAEAIKGMIFASAFFRSLGWHTNPAPDAVRADIIQSIECGSRERLIALCQAVQAASPVDSFVVPVPGSMPGYDCEIIMAAGSFTQGSSIELSADGPLRPPYIAYMQGGLAYEQVKLAVLLTYKALTSGSESADGNETSEIVL